MSNDRNELDPQESELWDRGQKLSYFILSLALTTSLFGWFIFFVAGKFSELDLILGLVLPLLYILLLIRRSTAQRMLTALSFFLDGVVHLGFGIHFAWNGISDFKNSPPMVAIMVGCMLVAFGVAYIGSAVALLFSRPLKVYLSQKCSLDADATGQQDFLLDRHHDS